MAPTAVAIGTMKVAQVSNPGGDFQIVEREIPKPGAGQVRIQVQACGVCHSDVLTKEGAWPGIQYPRVPGHEVAGIIDELGVPHSVTRRTTAGQVLDDAPFQLAPSDRCLQASCVAVVVSVMLASFQ